MEEAEVTLTNHQSPEFEFWMVRNPSFPQPDLLSADQLFSHGVLLPLHPFNQPTSPSGSGRPELRPRVPDYPSDPNHPPPRRTEPESPLPWSGRPGPEAPACEFTSASKRWKDVFTKADKEEEKKKKKEKKCGRVATTAAELNIINIWPFSRSRSAGNGGTRPPRVAVVTRKVNSAPCSRSNSAGSPRRSSGVHIGRSSPVWQVRRSGGGGGDGSRKVTSASGAGGQRARVLKLNAAMCIGYRQNSVCRSDEGVRGSNLFNIRSIFTKKVH